MLFRHHRLAIYALFITRPYLGYAQSNNSTLVVSEDGNCGATSNQTCLNSVFGNCCSSKGYCGSTTDYCGAGCQSDFGDCSTNSSYISANGNCGATDPDHQICIGSTFGSCCSEKGFCGSTSAYCGTGCQSDYGTCGGENSTVSTSPASQSFSPTAGTPTPTRGSALTSSSQATSAPESASHNTMTGTTAFKAGMGVLGGVLGLTLIGVVVFLLQRRKRGQQGRVDITTNHNKTKHFPDTMSEAPVSSRSELSIDPSPQPPVPPKAFELSTQRLSRAELDTKSSGSTAIELPSDRP